LSYITSVALGLRESNIAQHGREARVASGRWVLMWLIVGPELYGGNGKTQQVPESMSHIDRVVFRAQGQRALFARERVWDFDAGGVLS
jgi:hypothetical protein